MKSIIVLFFAATALWFAPALQAQSAYTGSVNGTVTDKTGAVVDGVKVTAISPALQGKRFSVTNEQGLYRFPILPVGLYQITYEREGFKILERERVNITAGFTVNLNVVLEVSAIQETVTVTGETPLIDVQNANVLNNFDNKSLTEQPNARDMGSIQGVAPGVRLSTPDVGGSQSGSIAGNTSYGYGAQARTQIDGVNTTEGRSSVGMYFDYGSFEEVSIVTAANDASMPVPGQFINIVLKGGGNQFHGNIYQDYEGSSFQSANINKTQLQQGAGRGSQVMKYHDTNGDFGGPIIRDRLWFFTSLRHQDSGRLVAGFPVENPQGDTNFTTKVQDVTYKLTGQIKPNHRLSHFIQWDRKEMPLRGAGPNAYESSVYQTNLPAWAANIQYDGTLSPKFILTTRLAVWGYNSMNNRVFEKGEVPSQRKTEMQTGNISGTIAPFRFDRRRIQFDPSATYFVDKFLGASHQFKFGWLTEQESRRVQNSASLPYNHIGLTYNSPVGSPDFTKPYRATIDNQTSELFDYQRHHGFFIQDQVRIGSRLSASLGVRWDYYRVYEKDQNIRTDAPYVAFFYAGSPLPNGYSIPASYPSYKVSGKDILRYPFLIAPRFGISWDLFGSGKTVLKANWGRFYSNPAPDFGNSVNRLQTVTYTFNWNDLNKDGEFQSNEFGSYVSNSGNPDIGVAKKIKNPSVDDIGVTLEQQLGHELAIRAGFVYRKQKNDWQRVDVSRTRNLFSKAVTSYDPGPDGIKNTADDRGDFQVWDIPAETPLPVSRYEYQTPEGNDSTFSNWEITATKRFSHRWSALATFYYTFKDSLLNGTATTPNMDINNQTNTTEWTAHFTGIYEAPWGVSISPILRGQSGAPLSRIVQVTGLRSGTFSAPVEPVGAYSADNIWIADLRLKKQVHINDRVKIDAFFDVFNLFNSNAEQSKDNITGRRTSMVNGASYEYQRFLSPSTILPPRVARVGVRFSF